MGTGSAKKGREKMEITQTRISQLTCQRDALFDRSQECGSVEGRMWAQTAEYGMLNYAANHPLASPDVAITVGELMADPVLGTYWLRKLSANPLYLQVHELTDNAPTMAGHAWIEGWFDQVKAYWEFINDKMDPIF